MEEITMQQDLSKRLLAQIERTRENLERKKYDDVEIFLNIEELCDLIKQCGAGMEEMIPAVEKTREFALSLYNKHDHLEASIRVMNV